MLFLFLFTACLAGLWEGSEIESRQANCFTMQISTETLIQNVAPIYTLQMVLLNNIAYTKYFWDYRPNYTEKTLRKRDGPLDFDTKE